MVKMQCIASFCHANDFNGEAMAAIEFQRKLGQAFELGGRNYFAPVQLVGDFLKM
ncbi:hypothetical protein KHA80_06650 [Anaerobacillus sp. HL2]|nr:hypothetical protein KHA80_06650 [Anaerobacillus sp. HL2]